MGQGHISRKAMLQGLLVQAAGVSGSCRFVLVRAEIVDSYWFRLEDWATGLIQVSQVR